MAKRALHDEGRELAMGQLALCGAWAGLCACVVVARWASLVLSEATITVSLWPGAQTIRFYEDSMTVVAL